jgi:hypothetical protein
MRTTTLSAAAVAAVTLGQIGAAAAQTGPLERRLSAATRIDCRFTTLATGTWDGPAASAAVSEVDEKAAFFDINVDEGTAEAEGRFGATFIVVRYARGYLHFMQMSDAGPLHLTTVLAQETTGGRLKAVQTRHEYSATVLPGFTSRPEMYVGDCEVSP